MKVPHYRVRVVGGCVGFPALVFCATVITHSFVDSLVLGYVMAFHSSCNPKAKSANLSTDIEARYRDAVRQYVQLVAESPSDRPTSAHVDLLDEAKREVVRWRELYQFHTADTKR